MSSCDNHQLKPACLFRVPLNKPFPKETNIIVDLHGIIDVTEFVNNQIHVKLEKGTQFELFSLLYMNMRKHV